MKSYLYCFVTILFFSTHEVLGKLVPMSPYAVTAFRFFIGGLTILPFALKDIGTSHYRFYDYLVMSLPGILNVTVSMLFFQLAIFYGKASLTALILSSNPLFVFIFSSFILKEKMTLKNIVSVIVGLFGMSFIIIGAQGISFKGGNLFLGLIFALLAMVTFALYTVVSKKVVRRYNNLTFNTVSFLVGSCFLMLICGIVGWDLSILPTTKNIAALLYMGIFISGIAYVLFFEGLKNIPAGIGSMFFFLKPGIAGVLAWLLIDDKLSLMQILGIVIVILAMSVNLLKDKGNKALEISSTA